MEYVKYKYYEEGLKIRYKDLISDIKNSKPVNSKPTKVARP
jgi:hypothetical protein